MFDMKVMFHSRSKHVLATGALCLFLTTAVLAQETSVNPGINDSYEHPDIDNMVSVLEREERAIYRYRHAIVAALGLEPGMEVADVGSGSGFFSRLIAKEVGPEGKVYAVDIARESLAHVQKTAREEGIANIETVLGEHRTTNLAADSVDLVFVCDTYHHFEYPVYMMDSIKKALRNDGRLVVLDFEWVKGVTPDFYFEHVRAGKGTFMDEIRDAGFELFKEIPLMKDQYYFVFKER